VSLTGNNYIDHIAPLPNPASGLHRASLTVEAALALPVFIFAMLSMTFLLRVFYIHEVMSHSLVNAVNEMALDCYGIAKSHATDGFLVSSGRIPGAGYTADAESALLSGLGANNAYKLLAEYNQTVNKRNLTDEDLNKLVAAGVFLYGFTRDPGPSASTGWNETFSWYLYKNIAAFGGDPGALPKTSESIADELLRRLNVTGGISGLDFSGSEIIGNTDILVSVTYDVKIPMPLSPVEKITLNQKAVARMWGQGD
jgi:hypothetical protein